MARGHPDYFGMSTFYKFGDLRGESILKVVGSTTQATLLELAYKGKTYGGYLLFTIDSATDETTFLVTLDGEIITWASVIVMKINSITDITQQLMRLTRYEYNGTKYNCTFSFAPNITFDYQFKLEVINDGGANVTYNGMLITAVVQ